MTYWFESHDARTEQLLRMTGKVQLMTLKGMVTLLTLHISAAFFYWQRFAWLAFIYMQERSASPCPWKNLHCSITKPLVISHVIASRHSCLTLTLFNNVPFNPSPLDSRTIVSKTAQGMSLKID